MILIITTLHSQDVSQEISFLGYYPKDTDAFEITGLWDNRLRPENSFFEEDQALIEIHTFKQPRKSNVQKSRITFSGVATLPMAQKNIRHIDNLGRYQADIECFFSFKDILSSWFKADTFFLDDIQTDRTYPQGRYEDPQPMKYFNPLAKFLFQTNDITAKNIVPYFSSCFEEYNEPMTYTSSTGEPFQMATHAELFYSSGINKCTKIYAYLTFYVHRGTKPLYNKSMIELRGPYEPYDTLDPLVFQAAAGYKSFNAYPVGLATDLLKVTNQLNGARLFESSLMNFRAGELILHKKGEGCETDSENTK
ncbi:MAG: hypothetical protein KDD48_05180 [Bdellovibrionales bacterium]|nr:hypothetical protein [Bdellovibrionales bacterium]